MHIFRKTIAMSNEVVISDEVARISFILKNKDNDIINNAKIKVKFVRPTQSGFDFKEELFLNKITNS